MGLLIDTSVFIGIERARQDISTSLARWQGEDWFVSCVTASELLHGTHRSKDVAIRVRRTAFVEEVFEKLPLVAIDLRIARTHAQIWAHLADRGLLIGQNDLWLAATAQTLNLGILTHNVREFGRVPGLRVEQWT